MKTGDGIQRVHTQDFLGDTHIKFGEGKEREKAKHRRRFFCVVSSAADVEETLLIIERVMRGEKVRKRAAEEKRWGERNIGGKIMHKRETTRERERVEI